MRVLMFLSFFQVYDGYDDNSARVAEILCGLEKPSPIKSTSNVVYIVAYQSEYDTFHNPKFKLHFKAVEPTVAVLPSVNECGDVQIALNTSTTYNITSPGYPSGYSTGLSCNWTLSSTDPRFHPIVLFVEVDLEDSPTCVSDYVKVMTSKDSVTWNEETRLCNANFHGPWAHRPIHGTPYLQVAFYSDWHQNRTGFLALSSLACGGELTDPNGVIEVSDIVDLVGLRMAGFCMYNITVRPGRTIQFEFEEFSFPQIHETCDSYIAFRNGRDDESPLLGQGKYCGIERPSIPSTSGRYAFVKYVTNLASNVRFKLKYREVGSECGRSIVLSSSYRSEVIMTPNYPNIPDPFSECVWTFMAPAGESITINFIERFDLSRAANCGREYVELRNGGTERAQILGSFCGNTLPPPITTTTNVLRVKFFTEVNDPKNGFKANVSISTCGGLFQAASGVIRSPGYGVPGAFPANAICDYRIKTRLQSVITLQMIEVDLPTNCELDHLEIYSVLPNDVDKTNDSLVKHGEYCGENFEAEIVGNSNEMLIRFKTFAPNTVYRGFFIKYNSTNAPCGGEINSETGKYRYYTLEN